MRRRRLWLFLALGLTSVGLLSLTAFAAAGTAVSPGTTVVHQRLPHKGRYTLIVTIPATATAEIVNVSVGSQAQDGVPVAPGAGQSLGFFINAKSRKLVVRVTASGPAVHFTVAAESASAAGAGTPTGPYQNLVWSDDFAGTAGTPPNPANWSSDVPGSGCGEGTESTSTTSPTNASLDGQGLAITALPNPAASSTANDFTSAQLDTDGHYSFKYGEIEARIEIPPGQGLCSAFWLLGGSSPSQPCHEPCPEIDVMEAVSSYPNVGFADLHGPVDIPNDLDWEGAVLAPNALSGSFHTWGLIWSPDELTWTLDGLPYGTVTPADLPPSAQWVFDTPMHIIFDLAVGGFWALDPTSDAGFPASLRVDWVRVYQ
jgi:beta-glucanase (GH16 family)